MRTSIHFENWLNCSYLLITFLLFSILVSSCDNNDVERITRNLSYQLSSQHIDYFNHEDDNFNIDTLWMELHIERIKCELELFSTERFSYYKYIDRNHLEEQTGRRTQGFAEPENQTIHSIWHPEGHEIIHVFVISNIGHPPALFNEGIAVALSTQPIYGFSNYQSIPTWDGIHIDSIALMLIKDGSLPDLERLIESESFFSSYSPNITYPVAGSFCKFLLNEFGIEKFKELISHVHFYEEAGSLSSHFLNVYDKSLSQLWDHWINQLKV